MKEDAALLSGFKAGDHESFEILMLKYRTSAFNFALRFVKDASAVEDIVQDSFADLYVYRDRYLEEFSFKTYLYAIIKNKSISYLRKRNRLSYYDVDIPYAGTPETDYIEHERCNQVREKINQLKDDYCIVLFLKEYEGFSYEEIAKIMKKSLGQVKILIFRARKKLKLLIDSEV